LLLARLFECRRKHWVCFRRWVVPPVWIEQTTYRLPYHYYFRSQTKVCLWSGTSLHHDISALGACRLFSTPYPYSGSWLGIGISKRSPNLTGSTLSVSQKALVFTQGGCSTTELRGHKTAIANSRYDTAILSHGFVCASGRLPPLSRCLVNSSAFVLLTVCP